MADPIGLGHDLVAYFSKPREPGLYRRYRDESGQLHTDDLVAPIKQHGLLYGWAADWQRGEILAKICARGLCGIDAQPTPDALVRLFRSRDGGITWSEESAEQFPVGAFLLGFVGDQVLLEDLQGARVRHLLYPSGIELAPPAGLEGAWANTDHSGALTWSLGGKLYDAAGNHILSTVEPESHPRLIRTPSWRFATWDDPVQNSYLGRYAPSGNLPEAWGWQRIFHVVGELVPGTMYGTVEPDVLPPDADACHQFQTAVPSLVDLSKRTIHPITDLGDCGAWLVHVSAHAVLRVATGGDCLNVRREPSTASESLGCFADGVLLGVRGDGPPPVVPGWRAVVTPSLEPGWAAEEFLQR